MQYLLYCVFCFKVQSTIGELFVANDVDATLAKCGVLHDGMPMTYGLHQRGTKGPIGSHPPFVVM
jgi:hypothetical protein